MNTGTPRVAVIGAGIVGLSAAYALRQRGADVVVFERGEPGNGQSGGDSRLFRHAHDDPRMVDWAVRSRAIWTEWEQQFGVELVSRDGAVALGPSVDERLPLLQEAGVPARRIEAAEAVDHLPILAGGDLDDPPAMFDETGGAIRTRAAIRSLAGTLGARLVTDEVLALRPVGSGVEVRAGGIGQTYDRVVVCAGQGTSALARQVGLSLPVDLQAHVRSTFAVRGEPPANLACLQDSSGAFGETGIYAAATPGNTTYAVGLSETVEVRDDASIVDPSELAEHEQRVRAYVERALPGLDPEPVASRHCWVTALPWSDDGVAVWRTGGAFFLAGHNLFKQAPALGRALAAAALDDVLVDDLHPDARLGAPR
ncbi:MAG TPA: FAD-dependent oxidoreductase [Egicoccus sp.]|nr:FAD-dependent oxidoreductase [Egicoccus sp.]HSK21671.1 FAD-dependent oxidoreductase [Egicoccus sp.]